MRLTPMAPRAIGAIVAARRSAVVTSRLCVLALVLLPACAPPTAAPAALQPERAATSTADVQVGVIFDRTGTPWPAAAPDAGIRQTLAEYRLAPEDDPFGHKTNAITMLINFVDPGGPYRDAWWFAGDGQADIYEALAVILYTEGHTNAEVRRAVAARYLWFCGGEGAGCSGSALINFLAYFQPWREPWMAPGGITQEHSKIYLEFARELVHQQPGLLTEWIPGADQYSHSADGLTLNGPVAWEVTPFHFANVHPTWDAYLRQTLSRPSDGAGRLWVLTMGEAGRVCRSQFVCQDMTQARSN